MKKSGTKVMVNPAALVAAAAVLLIACASAELSAQQTVPAGFSPYSGSDAIISDAQGKTVTLNIVGGQGNANSGFNFNGYGNGAMIIRVPTGWKVTVDFSVDSSLAHSLVIAPWSQHQAASFTPAFPGSAAPHYALGISKGHAPQHFSFTASTPGKYALVCAVPGHDDLGMFDVLEVSSSISKPDVLVK